jgi:hypothetical protein
MKRMAAMLAALGVIVVAVTGQAAVPERIAVPPDPVCPLVDVTPATSSPVARNGRPLHPLVRSGLTSLSVSIAERAAPAPGSKLVQHIQVDHCPMAECPRVGLPAEHRQGPASRFTHTTRTKGGRRISAILSSFSSIWRWENSVTASPAGGRRTERAPRALAVIGGEPPSTVLRVAGWRDTCGKLVQEA